MSSRPPDPPEPACALLRRCLPPGTIGLSILGDLTQEFDERVEAGVPRARLWFWYHAVSLSGRYALVRAAERMRDHDSLGGWMMEALSTLAADVRFGFRMLVKTPLLSLVAVVTLGLGVALTTHTFSTIYGAMLRGVPVPDHERLVYVGSTIPERGIDETEMSIHDFEDVRREQRSFEDVAAFYQGTVNVAGDAGPPERYAGAYLSGNALALVGVQPQLGRLIRPEEEGPDAPPVIVIGHNVWQNRYAADPAIVGRTIRVNGVATEIVGVMPSGFRFPFLEDVWLPHRVEVDGAARGSSEIDVFARLRDGTGIAAAQAELSDFAARQALSYPESNEGIGAVVKPYADRYLPREIQAVIWVMLAATFGVLLIACTNVANLLLARASARSREIGVRTALGASRWRVVRQLLIESLVIALLGGLIGVAIAWGGVVAYNGVVVDIYKPYWIRFGMDGPVLVFSLGVTTLAAVLAGTLPALRASGLDVAEQLKDEARGSSSLRLSRLTNALVVTEIAISCTLLIAAGFMVRSVINVNSIDYGFETDGILTGRVGLFDTDYPEPADRDRFFQELEERLAAEPGVQRVALTSSLPGLGGPRYYFGVEGVAYPTDSDYPVVRTAFVTEGFFETFGVQPTRGRSFDALEARGEGDPVVIVNESFAATYLDGTPVVGERIRLGLSESTRPWHRIIGVVPDMHVGGNVGGIGDDLERPERAFFPRGTLDLAFASFAVRVEGEPEALAPRMRSIVAELDPNLPVYELLPLERALEQATWAFGLFGSLFTIFGAVALFLASVGLYGVMAFGVSQRRRELAVRLALGARPARLTAAVVRDGATQLGLGMLIGVGLGALAARSLRVLLYGVDTSDPAVYAGIVLTLSATGLLACLVPARTATRTDPADAMRE